MNNSHSNAPILNLVAADGARLSIHRHGAHITSWTPTDGRERLFLSHSTDYRPTAAIRGGVPLIFPQFAGEGRLPKHGFARTAQWSFVDAGKVEGGSLSVRFRLVDDETTRAIWPQRFIAELAATIGGQSLAVQLSVQNSGDSAFSFTAALHTYLAVENIADAQVLGLHGLRYRDTANGGVECLEFSSEVSIEGEVDRIYFDAPQELLLREPQGALRIVQAGFTDTVVWNPGPEKGALMADLEPDGYRRMLCIEAAVVGRPVGLEPDERWAGTQLLVAG